MRKTNKATLPVRKKEEEKFNSYFYWSLEVLLLTWVVNSVVWHGVLHPKTFTTVADLPLCAGCKGLAMIAKFPKDYQFNQWTGHGLLLTNNAGVRLRGEGNELHTCPTCPHISCHSSWMLICLCCWLLETPWTKGIYWWLQEVRQYNKVWFQNNLSFIVFHLWCLCWGIPVPINMLMKAFTLAIPFQYNSYQSGFWA